MNKVRDKYAATATAKEGALTFVDGEPYYADRGPAGMRTHTPHTTYVSCSDGGGKACLRYADTYVAEALQV
jgi:hypothetical protein